MKKYPVQGILVTAILLTLALLIGGCSPSAAPSSPVAPAPATSAAPAPATSSLPAPAPTTPAPGTSAPAPAPASPGASGAPVVRIGALGGQTGPAAGPVTAWFTEMGNIFKYTNEVEGGIDGIKLDWRIVDNKGNPEGAITAYKELRDSYNPQIFVVIEDYYLFGIKDTINQDKSVAITSSPLDPRFYMPPQNYFSIAIPTSDGLAGYAKWVQQSWKGPGQPKIGVLYWDFASGEMAWNMARGWIAKQGIDTVPVTYKYTLMDFKPQLMRLRDAGVTHIWVLGDSQQAALVIRDMKGLGLNDKIPVTFNEMVEADVVLSLAGKDAEGYTILRSESPYSDQSEAAKLYTRIWEWAGKKDKWSDNRLPMTLKAVINAAVRQAAADVGKDKIDKIAIYNALNTLKSIDTWGNSHDFGYGPDRRLGVQTMKISKITGNGTVSISDFVTLPRTFEGIDK
jgi:ABC-type branched-subunit amino acid transport system substrate-binding protein